MERGALRFWRWGAVALFALGLLIPFPSAAADLSKEEAVKKVIEKVVLPSPNRETLRAHFWPHPLRPGDVITVFRPDGERWTIKEPTWFFWIDDLPEALFGHPARFVYVDVATGAITVQRADSWPALNGETLWGFAEEREDPRFVIYPLKRPGGPGK